MAESGYTRDERRTLAAAAAGDGPVVCPVCGGTVTRRTIQPPPALPYVRRRIWLICTRCKRSAAVDLEPGSPR